MTKRRPGKPRAKSKVAPKARGLTKVKTRARGRKATPSKTQPQDSLDKFVDAAARLLDLSLDPAWRPAVKTNPQVIRQQAALFADFNLPDEAESAPVFRA